MTVTVLAAPLLVGAAVAWAVAGTAARVRHQRLVRRRLGSRASFVWRSSAAPPDPVAAAGRAVAILAPPLRRRPPALTDRRLGAAALGAAGLAVLHPAAGALAAAAAVAPPYVRARTAARATADAAVAALPDAVDLLLVGARAGLPAAGALGAVASRAPPPWDAAFAAVVRRAGRGERLVDAIDQLAVHGGEPGRPLRAVLRSTIDDGADLVSALDRFAADARDVRRRRAEEAARRVPVRLLLPLVACSLPAFALLSIVPILVGALGSLDLT